MMEAEVVIVGAGPAGLATAACLKQEGAGFLILERDEQIGASWRRHYRRLHMNTDKARSALPHLPFPDAYPRYASRGQVVDYLEMYARHFGLAPRFRQEVQRIWREGGRWYTETGEAVYRSRAVVVATGYTRRPVRPQWPGQEAFGGPLLHSSQYQDGAPFAGQRVLVVGFGNSAAEIAVDLWEHGAKPALAVRSPVNIIPRDLFGLPLLAISIPLSVLPPRLADLLTAPIRRWKFGRLSELGLRENRDGPFTQIAKDARLPVIDVGTVELLREGHVTVHPAIRRFTRDGVAFENGRHAVFDAVVLATGYQPALEEFLEPAAEVMTTASTPRVSGGEPALPGLYFCGYTISARGVLNDIAAEARAIGAAIGARRREG